MNEADSRVDRALRAHLPRLYELRPVPDEFVRLIQAWRERRTADSRAD